MIAGRYTLEREIGRGGMGAVWLARDEVLGRGVAVKRIGALPGGGSPDLERAEREARLAARLNHPHVVAVFDLVTDGDERWLVMEHVDGVNLAELVRTEGPLSPDRAARLLAQVADALAAAHSAGVVHRDVKPSNILVTRDGQVKLSDFGIARAEADASLTQTGLVTGSPSYLAPEVASGEHATPASDVWALGATLYHALSGRVPYEVGDNVMGALYRIVHEEPPRLADAGWLDPLLRATMVRSRQERWSMTRVRDYLVAGPRGTAHGPAAGTSADPAADSPEDAEATSTQVLPAPVAPAPTFVPVSGTGAHAAPGHRAAAPPPAPTSRPPRRWGFPVLVGLALALLVGLLTWAILATSGPEEGTREPDPTPPADSGGAADPEPTAESMEEFIDTYLDTAPEDPEAGFRMLTPAFQQQSGGLQGYRGFWDTIDSADLVAVSADPSALTVTYTVEYERRDGSTLRDQVSLALVQARGGYKIAAEN